jgi:hypothetical protein
MASYRGVKRRLEAVFCGGGVTPTTTSRTTRRPSGSTWTLPPAPGARIRAVRPRSNTLRRAIFRRPQAFAAADE